MSARLIAASLLTASCLGCDGPPAPAEDAGVTPPCVHWEGDRYLDLEECVCVRPAERLLPVAAGRVEAVAVPEGLVVLVSGAVGHLFLVTLDGEVHHHELEPVQAGQPPFWYGYPLHVPGTNRVWAVSNRHARSPGQLLLGDEADIVLVEYDSTGRFETIARGVAPFVYPGVVMGNGNLIGRMVDGPSINERWAMFRPLPDGSVEQVQHPDPELANRQVHLGRVRGWPMPDGGAVVFLSLPGVSESSAYHRFSEDLELLGPAWGPTPSDAVVRADGSALLLQVGRTDMLIWQVSAEGTVVGAFSAIPDGLLPPDNDYLDDASVWEIEGSIFATWSAYPIGTWIQAFDVTGSPRWPEPRMIWNYDLPSSMRRNFGRAAADGSGHPYTYRSDLIVPNPGPPADEFLDELTIDRLGADGEYVWPEETVIQTCGVEDGRLSGDGGLWTMVGAHDQGVWVVWEDILVDRNGWEMSVQKVTLVRPDGSFAW